MASRVPTGYPHITLLTKRMALNSGDLMSRQTVSFYADTVSGQRCYRVNGGKQKKNHRHPRFNACISDASVRRHYCVSIL